MNELQMIIFIVIAIICCSICFVVGQTHPDSTTRMLIREELRKEQVRALVTGKVWTCTEIIWRYPGPLGGEITIMVLDCGVERISLIYDYKRMNVRNGDKIVLKMLEKPDTSKLVWLNSVDRYCTPRHLRQL